MNTKGLLGLLRRRLLNAWGHSMQGLSAAWKTDESIRVEFVIFPALVVIAIAFGPGKLEKILLIGSALFVIVVELLNTAIEKTIDRISKQRHELSKTAKDIGSAAVLVAIVNFLLVWLIIFV